MYVFQQARELSDGQTQRIIPTTGGAAADGGDAGGPAGSVDLDRLPAAVPTTVVADDVRQLHRSAAGARAPRRGLEPPRRCPAHPGLGLRHLLLGNGHGSLCPCLGGVRSMGVRSIGTAGSDAPRGASSGLASASPANGADRAGDSVAEGSTRLRTSAGHPRRHRDPSRSAAPAELVERRPPGVAGRVHRVGHDDRVRLRIRPGTVAPAQRQHR